MHISLKEQCKVVKRKAWYCLFVVPEYTLLFFYFIVNTSGIKTQTTNIHVSWVPHEDVHLQKRVVKIYFIFHKKLCTLLKQQSPVVTHMLNSRGQFVPD